MPEILELFPNAYKCLKGHASGVESMERELDDDRYYDIKVTRCSRCNIPLKQEYV